MIIQHSIICKKGPLIPGPLDELLIKPSFNGKPQSNLAAATSNKREDLSKLSAGVKRLQDVKDAHKATVKTATSHNCSFSPRQRAKQLWSGSRSAPDCPRRTETGWVSFKGETFKLKKDEPLQGVNKLFEMR